MLDFDAAQKLISEYTGALKHKEQIPLAKLNKRVLAQDVTGRINVPPADNSAMDGYAVNSADVTAKGVKLPLQNPIYAGQIPEPLKAGHAMRIFTGSILPAGADTIVIQENCSLSDNNVIINTDITKGDFVRYRGEDMAQGQLIIQSGTRLQAGHIGMLAAQGYTEITVYKVPKIGILTTGDEIIQPGETLPPAAIYDSNTALLCSLCENLGIKNIEIRHAPDDLGKITGAIHELSQNCDLVLSVGGVSVGEKDFIKPAISQLGGNLDLWRVRMKPGKPVALAKINNSILLGLPGNPVSAFVVFMLLASPLIRKIQGEKEIYRPVKKARIKLAKPIKNGGRTDFIRVRANYQTNGIPTISPYHLQSSGAVSSLGWADGLARLPINQIINNGDELDWYEFKDHLS